MALAIANSYAPFMQAKQRRQQALLSIIAAHQLSTQQELVDHLKRHKIHATQSSVSRDMEELGIVKVQGFYATPAASKAFGPRGLLTLKPAGDSLVVARCESGLAPAVAVEIDKLHMPEVVGTVAGDDTIFIAVDGRADQKSVLNQMRKLFPNLAEEA